MATPGLLINNAWKHPASSTIHTVASPFSGAALGEVVIASESDVDSAPVSYTHLTLPTTPYV